MIVTIDGPAGSGKSTAARRLAERIGFEFLDTGAMYRAVALACLRRGTDLADEEAVARAAREVEIRFAPVNRVLLDGEDVTDAIRTAEVTETSSRIALNGGVRAAMVELQRRAVAGLDVVTDGRDQGTVVFPEAGCKFFLTADPRERAARRHRELLAAGRSVTFEEVLAQQLERDLRDESRTVAPLRPAEDAIHIDTSAMSAEDVLDALERHVRARGADF